MNPCVQSSKMLPNRSQFLATYRRHQTWSLPDSIIYYITKKPSSAKAYKKIIQTCKYFFIRNPILILVDKFLIYYKDEWHVSTKTWITCCKNISAKIWITNELKIDICAANANDQNIVASIIPKIYQNNCTHLNLYCQDISINDFVFLASKCKEIILHFDNFKSDFSLKKLGDVLPSFLNLTYLQMINIPQNFDINCMYSYIKKNTKTRIYLDFSGQISVAYKTRLQEIINEIIQIEDHDFKIPYIYFPGTQWLSDETLSNLYYRR